MPRRYDQINSHPTAGNSQNSNAGAPDGQEHPHQSSGMTDEAICKIAADCGIPPEFPLAERLATLMRGYERRTRAAKEAGKPTDQRERLADTAKGGSLPEQSHAIDIARLALAGWVLGQDDLSKLPKAANTAAAAIPDLRGRQHDYINDYAVRELAMIYRDANGKTPGLSYDAILKEPAGPFFRFCIKCYRALGLYGNPSPRIIRNVIDRMKGCDELPPD